MVGYRASTPQVRDSKPGLGVVDSAFYPFSGSINEYQACLGTKHWEFCVTGRDTVRPIRRQLSAVDLVRRSSVAPAARETLSVRKGNGAL
ncbi:hypothetical protein TNCV_1433891 [Trichonephila clavipes]|nr:hypothetical protein TNCV_1433891 [Trichonephila clavipes]